jgi:hypothetical protein
MFARIVAAAGTAAAVVAAAPAAAEEGGVVEPVIGAEEFRFPLQASQSDWSGSADWASVSIRARPVDEAAWARFKALSLSFDYAGGAVSTPELRLLRVVGEGEMQRLYAEAEAGGLEVTVDRAEAQGDFLTVEGRFSAEMGPSEDYGRTVDLSDPIPVAGSFAVTLGPVE